MEEAIDQPRDARGGPAEPAGLARPGADAGPHARQFMKNTTLQNKRAAKAPADHALHPLDYFEPRKNEIVQTIQQLVEIESPSDIKQAVDRLSAVLEGRFSDLGGHTRFHRVEKFGNHLQVDFPGRRAGKPVRLLGHLDTVYPIGTLAEMPFRVADGRVWGPGTLDMKSGIALALHAIEGLQARHGGVLPRPVTVLLVSDEEVGSDSSRGITESLAKKSSAVLVLEPSYGPRGAVKTARKGVGEYRLTIHGKAAHSGLDFEQGDSAVLELAHQVIEISKLIDLKRGLTLNPGVIVGGTRVNVIAAEASAWIDVRSARLKDAAAIDRRLRSLKPFNRKCRIEITGGLNRPTMERSAAVAGLYRQAAQAAKDLGWSLEEAAVGGGSDGNFTAALGIPTLDGLGGVGEGAHALHESVLIAELPRRAALLAALIEKI
jgi:glutamate carboxypeptidase